jgi:Ser/Thr protein kinase RdoA (MazF antagonist)
VHSEVPPRLHGVLDRLARERGLEVARVQPIEPGVAHNNRLFRLDATDGRRAVMKWYFRDARRRLEREYDALAFLEARGMCGVPAPLLRDDGAYVGVYSFVEGASATPQTLTHAHLETLAQLVGGLRRIRPGEPGASFAPAVPAAFSLADGIPRLQARVEAFREFASSGSAYPLVRTAHAQWDPASQVERLLEDITRKIPQAELEATIPESDWGFAQGDLAPHNVVLQPGGGLVLLDFEYSGWDDPAAAGAAFLAADTSRGLPSAAQDAFIDAYREAAALTPMEVRRLHVLWRLMEVAWAAVHLSLLTPQRVAPKQFADPQFDLERHLDEQLRKLRQRLLTAESRLLDSAW